MNYPTFPLDLTKTDQYDIYSEEDLCTEAAAVLKRGEGRTVKAGGMWIYDNEIDCIRGGESLDDGDIIPVEDFDGYFMGYGYINRRSKIQIRLLSRRKNCPVTPQECGRHIELPSSVRRGGLFAGHHGR